MNRHISFFLIVFLLTIGCTQEKKVIIDINQLRTDWYSLNNQFIFFEDSLCYSNIVDYPYPAPSKFKLKSDTLFIYTWPYFFKSRDTIRIISKFKIIELSSSHLFLRTTSSPFKYFIFHPWHDFNKKHFKIESLAYSSTRCLGDCPVQCFNIENNCIFYRGYKYTKYRGENKLELNEEQLDRIQRKLSFIDLNSNNIEPFMPDAMSFSLKFNDVIIEGSMVGLDEATQSTWAILYLNNIHYFLPKMEIDLKDKFQIADCLNEGEIINPKIEEIYHNAP